MLSGLLIPSLQVVCVLVSAAASVIALSEFFGDRK